ncbi:uncharacterized protein LOC135213223 [Macrobrachium nipponense]|uniref:uncharacterized protein LOC135213223 n=1 Tax=Macrobrachium nipponense TaxID=159736 RepID=UPI0030C7DF47
MRRTIERRQEELDDLEDTKCRRKSYALAQRESLPIPLPLPVYPPPKPIARPPPPKTVFRPVGPGLRANARGYRPSTASVNLLPTTPEVPSTPPVRNHQVRGGFVPSAALSPTPEESSGCVSPSPSYRSNDFHPHLQQIPATPEASPKLSSFAALQGRPQEEKQTRNQQQLLQPVETTLPPLTALDITQQLTSIPTATTTTSSSVSSSSSSSSSSTSLPPTPPTHHHQLPPTPTSLSRSDTPTSLGTCPRTPTSIRAAPWQPLPPTASLTHKVPSSPTVAAAAAPVGATTAPHPPLPPPRSAAASPSAGSAYPPTPPSSPLRRLEVPDAADVASYSSLSSSVEQGLNHSRLSLGSSNLLPEPTPHLGEAHDLSSLNPSESSYPAVLDVMHLSVDVQKGTPTALGEESTVWGTFGSIAESAEYAFKSWTDATIAAFPNWGPIIVVFFTVPMMWVTQKLEQSVELVARHQQATRRFRTSTEEPDLVLHSDASDVGWGATLGNDGISSLWQDQTVVQVNADNTTALAYIKKQGGTRSDSFYDGSKGSLIVGEREEHYSSNSLYRRREERQGGSPQQRKTGSHDGVDPASRVNAHEVRAVATLRAYRHKSMESILEVTFWRSKSVFADCYLKDVQTQYEECCSLGPYVASGAVVGEGYNCL